MSTTLEKSSGKSDKSVRKKIEELGDELGETKVIEISAEAEVVEDEGTTDK